MYRRRRSVKLVPNIVSWVPRIILLLLRPFSVNPSAEGARAFQVAKTNCLDKCDHVSIPFPFGIGTGCFLDEWYEVVCLQQTNTSVPRLKKIGVDVLDISLPDHSMRVNLPISYSSPNCTNNVAVGPSVPPSLSGSNFIFSHDKNVFQVIGCSHIAFMNTTDSAVVACKPECKDGTIVDWFYDCQGDGCCKNEIPSNLQSFNISFQRVDSSPATPSGGGCSYAFLVEPDRINFNDFNSLRNAVHMPVFLEWSMGNDTSYGSQLMAYGDHAESFRCNGPSNWRPYGQCYCKDGYEGNPYLGDQGCQDIDECEDQSLSPCPWKCVNTEGSYKCAFGSKALKFPMTATGTLVGALLFLIFARWLCIRIKIRKKMKLKQKFFKQNGGLLLQQQLASPQGNVEKSKLFNSKELERATDNFNENRILGQGGQGTVYKGMLVDGRIVAIKKSKVPDKGKVEQFINEVSILSQINHRNVVKLLGCCLETEVPLLVYEFIPNGTLHQYLHDPNEEFLVPWDVRLRIASEVAGALSYLHSAASIPIYHRDIKATNILLDEKYQAKIADFGTSRLMALDKTHVTTLVQGTFGYLDPQYFQSSQFTDKSDVYSFGVVLVELLTGQKPISSVRVEEGIGLATYFILSMEEDHLFEILDARVLNQGYNEEIIAVAHLAKRCVNLNGRLRPSMKEVVMELESLRRSSYPSNTQEIEERSAGNFEIDVIESQDVTFMSVGFEGGKGMSSANDVYPLLCSNTC